jgi:hypothetical protein
MALLLRRVVQAAWLNDEGAPRSDEFIHRIGSLIVFVAPDSGIELSQKRIVRDMVSCRPTQRTQLYIDFYRSAEGEDL